MMTKEQWSSRSNNVCQCKQNNLRLEPIIDDISENIVVNLQAVKNVTVAAVRKK
jgi:hypothetical protein